MDYDTLADTLHDCTICWIYSSGIMVQISQPSCKPRRVETDAPITGANIAGGRASAELLLHKIDRLHVEGGGLHIYMK